MHPDAPLLLQLASSSIACFLIPTCPIVSASQGRELRYFQVSDLRFGFWILLHWDTRSCCLSAKTINKVCWSAGPACGEMGVVSWSQTLGGLCRVSLRGALPNMELMVREDSEQWNTRVCFDGVWW